LYSINAYGEMIADRVRREAYVAALTKAVRPGDLVLELGTGPGFFAFVACRLGARVVAVEPEPVIQVAREIATANGLADRLELIEASSDTVTLPHRADVLVSDLRGVLPLLGRHIASVADARDRLLKPGGIQVPARDEVWGAVVEVPATYARFTEAWEQNGSGLDMSAARRLAVNSPRTLNAKTEQLLTRPALWAALDYTTISRSDVSAPLRWVAERAGDAHGIALWFDSTLVEGVTLSNAPGRQQLVYGNLFLPFETAIATRPGDVLSVDLAARLVNDDYVWRWDTSVERDGGPPLRMRQSSFFGAPLSLASLRRRSEAHTPRLTGEGEVVAFLLDRMRGEATLGEIAREAAKRFPRRFPDPAAALSLLGDLSTKYGV
jgi:type I protein arginine methyltransferase